jgi:hypothetical protein
MLMKASLQTRSVISKTNTLKLLFARTFTAGNATVAKSHQKNHMGVVMDERFYENDFVIGKSTDLEVVRSPFYDLAKNEKLDAQAASALVEEVA